MGREGGLSPSLMGLRSRLLPGSASPPPGLFTGTSLGGRLEPIQPAAAQDQTGSKIGHNYRHPSLQLKGLFSSEQVERECACVEVYF